MEIKDQSVETAIDSEGHEYISEMDATLTDTSADGTVSVAEITTTADPNDPTNVESHMTLTETTADGEETVTEYVANEEGVFKVEEESALENAVEEMFGVEIGDDLTKVMDANGNPVNEDASEEEVYEAESDFQIEDTETTDFTVGDEMFDSTLAPTETGDVFTAETPIDSNFGTTDAGYTATPIVDSTFDSTAGTSETIDSTFTEQSETEAAELAEQEAHTQAATDAQNAADEFIAAGDYAAAAEARETAENESWEAGDDSMLSAYDAQDLTHAAEKQEEAEVYNAQQAEFAQAGDYEAAREAASNSAYATSDADISAGGADHTGQADSEYTNMDNAVWQEGIADSDMDNAAYYAEQGNFDAAESSLNSAAEHQAQADHYGDLGEHGGVIADYDPSSAVETGGTYDSSYDAAAVDTGFDTTAVDTTSTYDTTDDV